jgi:putative spermidine/putrescine transport system substrate-binding protein
MKKILLLLLTASFAWAGGGQESDADILNQDWDSILEQARGGEVNFYMWGGSDKINAWVDQDVAAYLQDNYGVRVNRVPMDASEFINKLLAEKLAGRAQGSIDLVWINGENFHRAKTEGLLLGSYAQILPNFALVNQEEASVDFGFATDGYETPYGKAQFVLEYDSAKISEPPRSFAELAAWVKANPGRFTYPEPPDFTGSAFIRQAFYETTGGYSQYLGDFNQEVFDANVGNFVDYMNSIEPYLWMEGKNFPGSKEELDLMFEKGEVDFNMSYTQAGAQGKSTREPIRIQSGPWPLPRGVSPTFILPRSPSTLLIKRRPWYWPTL